MTNKKIKDEGQFTSSTDPEARRDGETWAETTVQMTEKHVRDSDAKVRPTEPLAEPWGNVYDNGKEE